MKSALLLLFLAGAAQAQQVTFTACPVYRDTDAGRKSGCWLSDRREDGIRYDITQAPTKPDWNRAVLVEGDIAPTQDGACGGLTLDPVRVSVLPDACPRNMLPAEGFAGRAFVLPERTVAPLSTDRPPPEGPFTDRDFALFFDWNRDFIVYQYSDWLFDRATWWLTHANPPHIIVTGFAAPREDPAIATARAATVTEALVRMGIDPARIETRSETGAAPLDVPEADGLPEPSRRRVTITARF